MPDTTIPDTGQAPRPLGLGWRRGEIVWNDVDPDGARTRTGPGWVRIRLRGRWVEYRPTEGGPHILVPTREVFEVNLT